MMGDDGFFGWGAGHAAGGLFMILFWVVVIVGAIAVAKWLVVDAGARRERPAAKTPLQVLEERYARGELDREEFLAKKRDLDA